MSDDGKELIALHLPLDVLITAAAAVQTMLTTTPKMKPEYVKDLKEFIARVDVAFHVRAAREVFGRLGVKE